MTEREKYQDRTATVCMAGLIICVLLVMITELL